MQAKLSCYFNLIRKELITLFTSDPDFGDDVVVQLVGMRDVDVGDIGRTKFTINPWNRGIRSPASLFYKIIEDFNIFIKLCCTKT